MMVKQVAEWKEELIKVACEAVGHQQDHRFQPWAKFVNLVNESEKNGFAFEGDFINDGTSEIAILPRVFLVKTSSGSVKYQIEYYNVILMDAEGNLSASDVSTTGPERGWALRIRSDVARLVARTRLEAEGLTARPQAQSRTVTLSGAALETLAVLEARLPHHQSAETVVELALNELAKLLSLAAHPEPFVPDEQTAAREGAVNEEHWDDWDRMEDG